MRDQGRSSGRWALSEEKGGRQEPEDSLRRHEKDFGLYPKDPGKILNGFKEGNE